MFDINIYNGNSKYSFAQKRRMVRERQRERLRGRGLSGLLDELTSNDRLISVIEKILLAFNEGKKGTNQAVSNPLPNDEHKQPKDLPQH